MTPLKSIPRALLISLVLSGACRSKDSVDSDGVQGDSAGPVDADADGVDSETDCDDDNPDVFPGNTETPYDGLDNDCDPLTADDDLDGDGYPQAEDCDDADANIHPGAEEVCDGLDNDCDGAVDNDATDASTWYADGDGDQWGAQAYTTEACEAPEGYAAQAGDCDDGDAAFYPGAPEEDCTDPNDYNCDGSVGYEDADGDGYAACEECDDTARAVNPSATEVCDAVDNDCDGDIDEADAADAGTWYADGDADGYGDPATATVSCEAPSGYVADSSDCDDSAAAANPGATELCDGFDNDCDGDIDEADAADASTWYIDYDSDGYGNSAYTVRRCNQPNGYVADSSDCEDTDAAINPAATEVCDGLDNDCDALIDDADSSLDSSTATTWYADVDGDGYGDASSSQLTCDQPSATSLDDTDCDDADATVWPSAPELCDGLDNDCDGAADDGLAGSDPTCAAASCADVLADRSTATDGDYYLDPLGNGAAELYHCDMTVDGGGWTRVSYWNREDDGEGITELEAEMTVIENGMGQYTEASGYVQWADLTVTSDALVLEREVFVPNAGETLFRVHFYGRSMECSAIWMYVEDASSNPYDLYCKSDLPPCQHDTASGSYTGVDLAWEPYQCGSSADATWEWDEVQQASHGAEVTRYNLRSLMWDSGGDAARLYRFDLLVR